MDPLRCPNCCMKYNTGSKEPLVLPCGHAFCSSCIKSFDNTCTTCKEDFTNSKVKTNYVVHTLLDEMSIKVQVKTHETCETHRREIDRYCKSCWLLMCSVCNCPHVGSTQHIMSDVNLREEAERISEAYRSVDRTKADFSRKIEDHIDRYSQEIIKIQEYDSEIVKHSASEEIERVKAENEIAIMKIEQDAREKIQIIEEKKFRLINKANEAIKQNIQEIESRSLALAESLEINNKNLVEAMRNIGKDLKKKTDIFQELDKIETNTLEECAKIFQLEGLQKSHLQTFIALSQTDVDSLLNLKRFNIGETVDCLNTLNQWVDATVLNIQAGQARVQYIEHSLPKEEWIGINSSRLLKKWTKGFEFQLNNRVDICVGFNRWREGRVVTMSPSQVEVFYTDAEEVRKEWLDKDSYRLSEVGSRVK